MISKNIVRCTIKSYWNDKNKLRASNLSSSGLVGTNLKSALKAILAGASLPCVYMYNNEKQEVKVLEQSKGYKILCILQDIYMSKIYVLLGDDDKRLLDDTKLCFHLIDNDEDGQTILALERLL